MAVGKACGQELKQQEGTPESLHLGIGEAQCGGTLGCHLYGTIDFLKGFFGEDAIVADAWLGDPRTTGCRSPRLVGDPLLFQ
jgi:hypothetical protein